MKKPMLGLLAAGLLFSGAMAAPKVSAASSTDASQMNANWWTPGFGWGGYYDDNNGSQNGGNNGGNSGNGDSGQGTASPEIEKMISYGMKYKGTPYEFGSNRKTDRTFDCSDFVQWIFDKAINVELPTDSRKQGAYVKEHNKTTTDWHDLKRGDLMFFMSYEGSDDSDYQMRKSSQRITHVGIYLGNGKIMHTYSNEGGGVTTTNIEDSAWAYRFLFGGSAL